MQCVKVLVKVLSSEGTAARLFSVARDAPNAWVEFSSSLVRIVSLEGQPRLSKLASVVKLQTPDYTPKRAILRACSPKPKHAPNYTPKYVAGLQPYNQACPKL